MEIIGKIDQIKQLETEPFEYHESFGEILHFISITPKKELLYSKTDEKGNVEYYEYFSDKKESIESPTNSYSTRSNYYDHIFQKSLEQKKSHLGYLVPFSEYIFKRIGINITSLNPKFLKILFKMTPPGLKKSFILSFEPEEAKKQLEEIIYMNNPEQKHIKTKKKKL